MKNTACLALVVSLLVWWGPSQAQDLVFEGSDFSSWSHPQGLVTVLEEGIEVKRFGKSFNAVANAGEFSSSIIGEYGLRFARAPSNQLQAGLAGDQDAGTWWQPDPDDSVQQWWLEIDLGRSVVADKIRVIFPDEEGARPFNFFSVYVSPGIPVFGGTSKRVVFNRLGRPINNNTSQVVEFDLSTGGLANVVGENLNTETTLDFDVVRFIRFEAAGKTADAALAEIEVDGIGFNLSSMVKTDTRLEDGKPHWGGRTWTSKDRDCEGCGKGSGADALIDQDVGFRGWNIESSDKGNWRDSGVWSVVDFGNVYHVDRMVWMPIVSSQGPFLYGFQRDKQGTWIDFDFFSSDGTPSNSADPEVEGPFDYELLSSVDNTDRRYLFDFQFPTRDIRLLMWRVTNPSQFYRAVQLFVFHAEGYPAQVELESEDISLGGARSIRAVEWDADLPPGTSIEVETQTGNGFEMVERYFLTNGKEVTKEAYEAAKSRNRADIVEENVRDDTWSSWSRPHRFSGQEFQSPSPRQWVRARVRLISEDPEVIPTLRSLRFVANAPVITAGLTGRIFPREAAIDSLQEFRYTIIPGAFRSRDAGFDQVLVELPPGGGAEFVGAMVGGGAVEAIGLMRGDSLVVQLPPPAVRRDSVEVVFRTRLAASPTSFNISVLNSEQEENAQGVVPSEFGADLVYVPDAVAGASLVRNIAHRGLFTPNGDGANDQYELSFTVVKTERDPRVRIYSLDGRQIAELENAGFQGSRARYLWDGSSVAGAAPPGVYIVGIEVNTDDHDERVYRLVHIAY
ncbi:MAG: hypothetical protein GKR89_14200 [Candidatus Latescibacteria bacterium]|nr:hypothetical protein [Candidatus Latescibacterota bacterium]